MHRAIPSRFGFATPLIIQAPMAGGISTPALVAAVSEARGLGSFATGYLTPQQVAEGLDAITKLTSRPFAANLFIPSPTASPNKDKFNAYQSKINSYKQTLGMSVEEEDEEGSVKPDYFSDIVALLLDNKVPVVSFTFGNLPVAIIEEFHRNGTYLIGTATSLDEAKILSDSGIDAIVLQGAEAGGHRGGFFTPAEHGLVGTMSLVDCVSKQRVDCPLIAAGGIMTGAHIAAAIRLGASGVQMGTAFITTHESGASRAYKNALLQYRSLGYDPTCLTTAFSGKLARGIANQFTEEMRNEPIPEYPLPHWISSPMRRQANLQGNIEFMSMWAGQGVFAVRDELPVSSLINSLRCEL